jgi:hypothetical protein
MLRVCLQCLCGLHAGHRFEMCIKCALILIVCSMCSGLVSQFCDVVLVRAHLAQENPRGSGFWNGEGMEMGRSVYQQPGTKVDGILSQQGGFPSK